MSADQNLLFSFQINWEFHESAESVPTKKESYDMIIMIWSCSVILPSLFQDYIYFFFYKILSIKDMSLRFAKILRTKQENAASLRKFEPQEKHCENPGWDQNLMSLIK